MESYDTINNMIGGLKVKQAFVQQKPNNKYEWVVGVLCRRDV